MTFRIFSSLAAVALSGVLHAAPEETPASDFNVDQAIERRRSRILENINRQGITGGWFGAGAWLQERGVRLEAAATFFGQDGLAASGNDDATFGGKFDGLLRLDLDKLGLWKGLHLTAHPEYNFGDASNGVGGTVLPVNVALQLPGSTPGSRFDLSSLFLTQRFNETFSLIAGKTNLADVAALHPYAGGAGLTGFMSAGLAAAPNGAVPPYAYGGILLAKTKKVVFSFGVYGGESAQGKLDFQDAFRSGQLFSIGVTIPVRPANLPGVHSLSVLFGNRDASSLASLGDLVPPGSLTNLLSINTDRQVLSYSFHQAICQWNDGKQGWGIWGRAGLGENQLTAIAWSAAAGVGGTGTWSGREADRWGIGCYYFSFADYLRDPSTVTVPLRDEYGLELFYNARITSWLRLTADLQVVRPGVPGRQTAVIAGLRTLVRF